MCAASLFAQGPATERYHPVKLEKIDSHPQVPIYHYRLSGGQTCTMDAQLRANEGSEIKTAFDGHDWYIMDNDGKTYKCKFVIFVDGPPPIPKPTKK